MRNLNQIKPMADRGLGGLQADAAMKQAIVSRAAAKKSRAVVVRRVAAAVCALVLAVGLAVYLPNWLNAPQGQLIQTQSAGDGQNGTTRREKADLGNNNVTVSTAVPEYSTLWSKATGGVFPLLKVDGRWYRLMTSPAAVDSKLLGQSVGQVGLYTAEPSLAQTGDILSNTVSEGASVYTVISGTLLAAEVNGKTRLFQRVSFNDEALIGKEKLTDTLNLSGHIASMELSDVGVIDDSATAEQVFKTLLDKAEYVSAGAVSGKQSLHIELDSGLTVQLLIRGDRLSACGVWSCPEFIEAFEQAVAK